MRLGNLLKFSKKNYQSIFVSGISFDSRIVKKGDIFFAIKGKKDFGLKYINEVIHKGAVAIIIDKKQKINNLTIPIIRVENVRKSLSRACSILYKNKPRSIFAVTGTNGKSSVADFYYQIMNMNKILVASIGTLGIKSQKYRRKTNLTSIDPLSLHKILQILKSKKINNIILEASSIGLDQNRLDYLKFKAGIFTNLSHDHLDYHKNMKSYFKSKMYLFNNLLKKNSKIITDNKIKEHKDILNIAKKNKLKKITIGNEYADLKILAHKYKNNKQIVKIMFDKKIYFLEIPLIGYFQVKNLLMAALTAITSGLENNKVFNKLHKIKSVSGRLENITSINKTSNVILDFAHTPDALEQSLIALKKQFKKEIILVLGCGGDRDKRKRFVMGKIAKKYCQKIYVTDDNPRNESPHKIRKEIIKGCKNIAIDIADRRKAIEKALTKLKLNEILLVSGKGHETEQNYGNKILKFSDKKIIKKVALKLKKKNSYRNYNYLNSKNYSGVSINSKTIKKNNLFFAIKGKKNNGHKFARDAIKKGAKKVIISEFLNNIPKDKVIKVTNTLSSLKKLAITTRQKSVAQIIGITGSVGKTTLKNLTSHALKKYGKVYNSPYSFNNKFGVPLSVSNLKEDTDFGVFEIGMDKKGEIDELSKIVRPEIAIITNISEAHLKNFKTLKDIAEAKGEIIQNISKGGNLILNKNCKFFSHLSKKAKKRSIKVITFGKKNKSDIFLSSIKKKKNYFIFKVIVKNEVFFFESKYKTQSFINNLLACISIIYTLGLDLKKIKKDFKIFQMPEGRGDIVRVKRFNKKFNFIDESYNANPLSMRSAINNINSYTQNKNNKKFIFLGDMLELGNKSKNFHKKLSYIINKTDINKVFVYGNHIKETFTYLSKDKKGKIFNNLNQADAYLGKILHNNDLLMIKGSNATGLNKFSKNIKKGFAGVI